MGQFFDLGKCRSLRLGQGQVASSTVLTPSVDALFSVSVRLNILEDGHVDLVVEGVELLEIMQAVSLIPARVRRVVPEDAHLLAANATIGADKVSAGNVVLAVSPPVQVHFEAVRVSAFHNGECG